MARATTTNTRKRLLLDHIDARICKSEYGLKGSRESVLRQMQALVDAAIAAKQAQRECQCTNYAGDNGACNATH
jgi:hypothetical protein